MLYKFDNESLLFWRRTTKDNRSTFFQQFYVQLNKYWVILFDNFLYRCTFDNKSDFGFRKFLKLLNDLLCFFFHIGLIGPDSDYFKVSFDKIGEIANVLCSLEFVSGDHHDGNASLLKTSDGLRDLVLKFVFNCGCSEYVKLTLSIFNESKFDFFDFLGSFVFVEFFEVDHFFGLVKLFIFFLCHFTVAKHQSSESFNCILIDIVFEVDLVFVGCRVIEYSRICSFCKK